MKSRRVPVNDVNPILYTCRENGFVEVQTICLQICQRGSKRDICEFGPHTVKVGKTYCGRRLIEMGMYIPLVSTTCWRISKRLSKGIPQGGGSQIRVTARRRCRCDYIFTPPWRWDTEIRETLQAGVRQRQNGQRYLHNDMWDYPAG